MLDQEYFTEKVNGQEVKFKTRAGIFSKVGLDAGSRLLVENMKITDGTLVCDLGCGAGVIGLFAARNNLSGHVHLLDSNLRAVNLAWENVDLNRAKNTEVFLSDLFSGVDEGQSTLRTYHVILSNPPQSLGNEFLEECASESFKHLKEGGTIYWVVQKHVKPVIDRLFKKYFGNCKIEAHSRDYVLLSARKDKNV